MGFPAGYSEFIISKLLFNAVFLLASIRNGICWFLRSIGIADFLEQEFTDATENSSVVSSVTAEMIRERLPVVTFGVLAERFMEFDEVTCAVCLNEFDKYEEIRQLTNCCHIFHKNCLDKWLDHDQKTCPLCRSCLMPERIETENKFYSFQLGYLAKCSHACSFFSSTYIFMMLKVFQKPDPLSLAEEFWLPRLI